MTKGLENNSPFAILDGIIQSTATKLKTKCEDVSSFSPGKRLELLLRKQAAWLLTPVESEACCTDFVVRCSSVQVLHDAAYLCRAFLEVVLDHDDKIRVFPLQSLLSLLDSARMWPEEHFLKIAKFISAWPYARYLNNWSSTNEDGVTSYNPLPKTPLGYKIKGNEPNFQDFLSGPICKYLKNRMAIGNHRNNHLWWSWLQGIKRGCADATDATVLSSLEGHSTDLSKPGCISLMQPDDAQSLLSEISNKASIIWDRGANPGRQRHPALRKTDRKPEIVTSDDKGQPLWAPTSGASFESRFGNGGTHNWLYEYMHDGTDREEKPPKVSFPQNGMPGKYVGSTACKDMTEMLPDLQKHLPKILKRYDQASRENLLLERDRLTQELMIMWYEPHGGVREERGKFLESSTVDLVRESRRSGGKFDHVNVTIIPLKEPLKIRMISKGNALKYWLAKPAQKTMRKTLFTLEQFALIGDVLKPEHLTWLWSKTDELVQRVRQFCPDLDWNFSHIVSGDYKGATDGLDIQATKATFEEFLKCASVDLPENEQCMYFKTLRDVLYEQVLHYPKVSPEQRATLTGQLMHEKKTVQTNGQLMGSNLSFPILCSVNLIGYWMALEEYTGLKFEPQDLPVLINGDDILFRTPRPRPDDPKSFYELWKSKITQLGFELSVGKNYVHDKVFTINSQCWHYKAGPNGPVFRRTRHLDVGILTKNNSAQRQEIRALPLEDRLNKVLEGAWNKQRCWRRLKHYYAKEIKAWTLYGKSDRPTTFNVFAHSHLGGRSVQYEFPEHKNGKDDIDPGFTNFQRRFAFFCRKKLTDVSDYTDFKKFERTTLSTTVQGKGLTYEIPRASIPFEWKDTCDVDENDLLEVEPEIRNLPTLSRSQPLTTDTTIKTFTLRRFTDFKKVYRTAGFKLDASPGHWSKVLTRINNSGTKLQMGL